MGYRSEAAFCLQVKEPEKFVSLMKLKADDTLKEMLDNMYYFEDHQKRKYIMFKHSYWKWYNESDKAFAEILNMAEAYDEEFACRFARSGENLDDVEEEAHGEMGWDLYYPYVVRAVEIGTKPEQLQKIIKEEDHATTS
jgi:hypothetical protein